MASRRSPWPDNTLSSASVLRRKRERRFRARDQVVGDLLTTLPGSQVRLRLAIGGCAPVAKVRTFAENANTLGFYRKVCGMRF